MKILLVSYGIVEYDGRFRELLKISQGIGETHYIARSNSTIEHNEMNGTIINTKKRFDYLLFIYAVLKKAISIGQIDILFIDNRKAIIPGLLVKMIKSPVYVIQDVRELYLAKEVRKISRKIGCYIEGWLIRRANILISANKYRSKFMKDFYSLNDAPLVFENIRRLEIGNANILQNIKKNFSHYFEKNSIRLISTSGYDINRTNDVLLKAMKVLGNDFELFLVGGGEKNDLQIIEKIIAEYKITNVNIINKLNPSELKYFIQNSHIGVVNYNQKDTNNKLCASGKIYEFIFEGLPVLTTENLPLVELVDAHMIGVADNGYYQGIKKISANYEMYKENVEKFAAKIDVIDNNNKLIQDIKLKLNKL